jgi:hypothetical protein
MLTPTEPANAGKWTDLFDLKINVVSIIGIVTLIFSAAFGLSKFETRLDHESDMKLVGDTYVRKDVNSVTETELKAWREEIRESLKMHTEQMDRIEKKLDQNERFEKNRRE